MVFRLTILIFIASLTPPVNADGLGKYIKNFQVKSPCAFKDGEEPKRQAKSHTQPKRQIDQNWFGEDDLIIQYQGVGKKPSTFGQKKQNDRVRRQETRKSQHSQFRQRQQNTLLPCPSYSKIKIEKHKDVMPCGAQPPVVKPGCEKKSKPKIKVKEVKVQQKSPAIFVHEKIKGFTSYVPSFFENNFKLKAQLKSNWNPDPNYHYDPGYAVEPIKVKKPFFVKEKIKGFTTYDPSFFENNFKSKAQSKPNWNPDPDYRYEPGYAAEPTKVKEVEAKADNEKEFYEVNLFENNSVIMDEDLDKDGLVDGTDICPYTEPGLKIDEKGCSEGQLPIYETG